MNTRLNYELSQSKRIGRLEDTLARIIDDPMVVKLLLFRDPEAWTDAVELLSDEPATAAEGGQES